MRSRIKEIIASTKYIFLFIFFLFLSFNLFSQSLPECDPPIPFNPGDDTTIDCGASMEIGENVQQEDPDFDMAEPECPHPGRFMNNSLTQGGGVYINSVTTSDGIENINNPNNLVDANNIDPMGPDAWSTDWYSDFTDQFVEACAGETFFLNITAISLYNNPPYQCRVWIDWNNDGGFAEEEIVYTSELLTSSPIVLSNIPIEVPAGQQYGDFRMRIRFKDNSPFVESDNSCTYGNPNGTVAPYGGYTGNSTGYNYMSDEIEEYTVRVTCGSDGPSGDVTYTWEPEDGLSDPSIPNPTATPDETTTYTLTITDTEQGCVTVYEITLTVPTDEEPEFTNPGPICSGQNFTLPTTSDNGISGTWSPAENNTETTEYTFTPNSTESCASETTMIVEVLDEITPTFTNPGPVCLGQDFVLPTTSENGVNGTWSPAVNTNQTTEYTFTPDSSEECATPTTMTVEVLDEITPTFTNPGPICNGNTFTLPTTSNNGVEGSWSPAVNTSETTEYTFTPNDIDGCASTTTMTVEVFDQITPDFSELGPFCEGETYVLPSVSDNGINGTWTPALNTSQTTTYTFTPDGDNDCSVTTTLTVVILPAPQDPIVITTPADCGGSSHSSISNYNTNNQYDFTPPGPIVGESGNISGMTEGVNYTVSASIGECNSDDSDPFSMVTLDQPIADFSGEGEGCAPVVVQFNNYSQGATSYFWEFGDGSTSTEMNPIHSYNQEGCYTVTLTVTNNDDCSSTMSIADYICVTGTPIASFTASTNEVSTYDNTVYFNNTSSGATSYQWFFGDGSTSNLTNPSYDYDVNSFDNFPVMLIAENDYGCADTAWTIIEVAEEIIFYIPNSFTPDWDDYNGIFKPVFSPGTEPYEYVMYIYNRWGEIIFETHNIDVGWDGSYKMNNFELCKEGIYIWRIQMKISTKKDDPIEKSGHVTLIR